MILNHIAPAIFFRPAPAKAGQAISKFKIAHCQAHSGIIKGPLKDLLKEKIIEELMGTANITVYGLTASVMASTQRLF